MPFKTIRKAMDNSNDNTTIFLLRGEYKGSMNRHVEMGYNLTVYGLYTLG